MILVCVVKILHGNPGLVDMPQVERWGAQAAVGCKEKRSPGKISGNCVLWEPLCLGAVRAQFACISILKTTNDSLYKNAMHVCTAFTYSAHLAVW